MKKQALHGLRQLSLAFALALSSTAVMAEEANPYLENPELGNMRPGIQFEIFSTSGGGKRLITEEAWAFDYRCAGFEDWTAAASTIAAASMRELQPGYDHMVMDITIFGPNGGKKLSDIPFEDLPRQLMVARDLGFDIIHEETLACQAIA